MTESIQLLVVDDEADVREMLDDYSSGHGYDVTTLPAVSRTISTIF